jgi:PPM family protein phosphatase
MTADRDDTAKLPASRSADARPKAGESSHVAVELAALSHTGRVRTANEDHFLAVRFERTMDLLASNLPTGEVPDHYAEAVYGLLVADGVGGSAAGEIASRTAIHALVDLVLETPDWIMRLDDSRAEEVLQRMEHRFQQVREVLVERTKFDPTLKGMATTMTVACSLGPDLLIAHVGDSRAYVRRRGGRFERLTQDQTVAQSLADAGAILPAAVARHPSRHVLTSALATRGAFVQVQLHRERLEDGDQLLLCSDGLTEMVDDAAISRVLDRAVTSGAACRELVDLALAAGGKDNITVVLARYNIPEAGLV